MKKSKNMWNRFVNVVSGVGGVNEDDELKRTNMKTNWNMKKNAYRAVLLP